MKPLEGILAVAIITFCSSVAEAIEVTSPDGKVIVELALSGGEPTWQVAFDGKVRLERGRLGVKIGGEDFGELEEITVKRTTHRETVETAWGRFAAYDNHFHQLSWTLREVTGKRRSYRIIARVYNGGVGLRYAFDTGWGESMTLMDDRTEFHFAADYTGWAHNGEHDPVGPQPLSEFREHRQGKTQIPLTLRCEDGVHMAVLEAGIFDHAPFELVADDTSNLSFRASLEPSKLSRESVSSWRVLLLARSA